MVFPKVTYKTTPNKLLAQSSWYESLYMFCYHLTMGTIVTSLEKKKKKRLLAHVLGMRASYAFCYHLIVCTECSVTL
jgi:hypothetical protein